MSMKHTGNRGNFVWVASLTYLVALALAFDSFWSGKHFPSIIELFFKLSALAAFLVALVWPFVVMFRALRSTNHTRSMLIRTLKVTACIAAILYALFLFELVYIKLRTCNVLTDTGTEWWCHVDSNSVIAQFVVVPFLAAGMGILWNAAALTHELLQSAIGRKTNKHP